ncbi:MAG: Rpn family recombination-promoting nuclease/putative transposase [Candidatus Amoebophilus sp.]
MSKAIFPVIVNTVLYTGKRSWNYSTAFSDYYANPSLGAQYLYMAPFSLVQLPTPTKEGQEIYTDKDLGFCFVAFYCGRSRDAYLEFERFKQIPAFKNYFNKLSVEERELVGRYIGLCVNRNRYSLEKIVNLIIINEQEKEEIMRSVAQEYIKQGIQQGLLIKSREVAKNMLLKLRLDIDTVQKATELTKEELQQILKKEEKI